MISRENLERQLKRIHFHATWWGNSEINELCNILMPQEEIDECANGYYEAGFALLVATKDRLLLVDKKPLNYLVVVDMRFDMINEFDYSHRFIGAQVKVSAGAKTLHFTSWNQIRLRRLLAFVQYRMTEIKKIAEDHQQVQKAHLEQMNQQLQMFLAVQQYQLSRQHMYQQAQSGFVSAPGTMLGHMSGAIHGIHGGMEAISPGQLGVSAMKRVVPVIGAYTRLPLMSQRRRYQATT